MPNAMLLKQLELHGLSILPMLEHIECPEVRHAVREFISTVQAVRILCEKFPEPRTPDEASDISSAG